MILDLSIGATILLLTGTHVFAGCVGFILGGCLRISRRKPPEDRE